MAVVISSEENNYFSSNSLRRSHSEKFAPPSSSYPISAHRSDPRQRSRTQTTGRHLPASRSLSSSPTISHDESSAPSVPSTPASSVSLDASYPDLDDDQILFPLYDDVRYPEQLEDVDAPASLRGNGGSYTVSPATESTSTDASQPESPDYFAHEHAEDDTAVRIQPSRHVDYLSHTWKEEDIWSSWKHIVSKRGAYSNSARLENASWRTWMKAKNKLKTVSPETLNWLKDCDVTWLYGPLQTASHQALHLTTTSPVPSSRLSKSNSFLHKKPILKKRSMSEIMLQRSLSSSSLLKQAAASVQAQQSGESKLDRPLMGRAQSDYITFPFSSRRMSRENSSVLPSVSSSGIASPYPGEKKHIHFNEQVEQCIALEIKGDDDEDFDYPPHDEYDSDSDDGAIMMKRSNSARKLPLLGRKSASKNSPAVDSKTIAMLPSTTLKYREDTPEPQEGRVGNNVWGSSTISPSPSQETLRPSRPSTRMLILDNENDEDDDVDIEWQPSAFINRKDSVIVAQERLDSVQNPDGTWSPSSEPSGMRRTASGMFMPYEEDEDDVVSEGLFGRVVDTVNTAKDIAHVIWNVGWRR